MTRRKFIQKLIKTGSVFVTGTWFARVGATLCGCPEGRHTGLPLPRKFVRAFRVKKYPGYLRPLQDISKQSKWSG